jgi:hypothetical protein
MPNLPQPDSIAAAHSAALERVIRERIVTDGGWLSFADYMQLALYAPTLGYYSAGARKFGAAGDFVTAAELSPLFATVCARQMLPLFAACGAAEVLELGPGTGVFTRALLARGEQDVDPAGLIPPAGTTIRGASSDHLVVEGDGSRPLQVGDEQRYQLSYSALLRAMTSPFVGRRFVDNPC